MLGAKLKPIFGPLPQTFKSTTKSPQEKKTLFTLINLVKTGKQSLTMHYWRILFDYLTRTRDTWQHSFNFDAKRTYPGPFDRTFVKK